MSMTSTTRHLQFATGYIDLGMINEASDDLEAIDWDDRIELKVPAMRMDLDFSAKKWEPMASRGSSQRGQESRPNSLWTEPSEKVGSYHPNVRSEPIPLRVICRISRTD